MRVLVLTPYLYGTAPGPRSSIELWEEVLRPDGITFHYEPFETKHLHAILYRPRGTIAKTQEMLRGLGKRIKLIASELDFDAVLIYREAALIGPALVERLVAKRGIPIIYQLDDPLYVRYRSPTNGYLSYLKFFGKVGKIASLSAVTIVNSDHHRRYVSRFTDRIRQIPSVVDGTVFECLPRVSTDQDPVCVGWSGSSSTKGNLQIIRPVLQSLSQRNDTRLHFIGDEEFELPGVRFTSQPWRAESEVEDLRSLDVGLVPLPTNEWTKRKFYLKLVQYNALGIPAVCTPLGANPQVVIDGETGFLASDIPQWTQAVRRLIENQELRLRMGARAAERAHAHFTVQANTGRIREAFEFATHAHR
jgi:glycosyltransferase involved in cell wall biosynthesis